MRPIAILAIVLLSPAAAQEDGRTELDQGRRAYSRQQYPEALSRFEAAERAARAEGDRGLLLECLRLRAAVQRDAGDAAQAERALRQAAEEASKAYGENSVELAAVLEEMAAGDRAQGRAEAGLEAIGKAIKIREAQAGAGRAGLAHDLTLAAVIEQRSEHTEAAMDLLKRAIQEWSLAQPGDPQCVPAIEALAGIYRDRSQYAEAEPLLQRAVRLREAAGGTDSAELIPAVDSLAYVEFGLEKYADAEPLYRRLLGLWEKNAGPDHPMVALTLDKLAEFYAFQHRYEEAEKVASAAQEMRARTYVASLNQTGRVLLMEARLDDAADLYHRTQQIGDLARAPDDVMDAPLRIYAKVLRQMGREREAATVERRVKEALIRKADREGRRPAPGPAQH